MWVIAFAVLFEFAIAAPDGDRISTIPNLVAPEGLRSAHYAGYLNVSDIKRLFYWYVESEQDPSKDPVVLWLNGGPGCSSLEGLFIEMGPFRVMDNGSRVIRNAYTWNRYANIIYLDAPANVGLSYRTDKQIGHSYTDAEVANDNYVAIKEWLKKFPERAKNEFYIAGESYAGVYIPTLSSLIIDNAGGINFKGVLIGNGVLDDQINFNTQIYYAYYHGLLDETQYHDTIATCCPSANANCDFYTIAIQNNSECAYPVMQLYDAMYNAALDSYFLYFTCYMDPNGDPNAPLPDCSHHNDYVTYLNMQVVRDALKIPKEVGAYTSCSSDVEENYDDSPQAHSINQKDNIMKLVKAKKKVTIFNGDVDSICNYAQNSQFLRGLGLKLLQPAHPYSDATQLPDTIGMYTQYDGIDFLTVKGGGHFPASTAQKPKEALQLFVNFINGYGNYSVVQPPDVAGNATHDSTTTAKVTPYSTTRVSVVTYGSTATTKVTPYSTTKVTVVTHDSTTVTKDVPIQTRHLIGALTITALFSYILNIIFQL